MKFRELERGAIGQVHLNLQDLLHHKEMVEHFTVEAKNRSTHLAAVNSRSILEHHYKNLLLDHKEHLAAAKSTEEKAAVHTRLKQAHDAVANSPYTDIDNIHRTVQHLQ